MAPAARDWRRPGPRRGRRPPAGRLVRGGRVPHAGPGADQPGAAVPDRLERARRAHPHQPRAGGRGRPGRRLVGLRGRHRVDVQPARGRDVPQRRSVHRRRRAVHLPALEGPGEVDPLAGDRERRRRDQARRPHRQVQAEGASSVVPRQNARALERSGDDDRQPTRPRGARPSTVRPHPSGHGPIPGDRARARPGRGARKVRRLS